MPSSPNIPCSLHAQVSNSPEVLSAFASFVDRVQDRDTCSHESVSDFPANVSTGRVEALQAEHDGENIDVTHNERPAPPVQVCVCGRPFGMMSHTDIAAHQHPPSLCNHDAVVMPFARQTFISV